MNTAKDSKSAQTTPATATQVTVTQLDRLLRLQRWTPKDLAASAAHLRRLASHSQDAAIVDQELVAAAASAWSAIETDDSRLLNAAANAWRAAAAIAPDQITAAADLVGKPLHLPVLVAIAASNGKDDKCESGMQDLVRLVASNHIHPSVPLDYLVRAIDLISRHPSASASALALWPFALNLLRHASLKAIRTTLLAATLRLIPSSSDPIPFILDNTLNTPISTRLYLLATALSSPSSSSSSSTLTSSSPLLAPTLGLAPTLLADPHTGPAAAAYLVAHHASTTYPLSSSPTSLEPWLASWLLASSLPLYPRLVASPLLARFPASRKLAPQLIAQLVTRDPAHYVPAAVAAVQALDLPVDVAWLTRLAHVHASTDTRQFACELDPHSVVPLAWMGDPGVGPRPAYPWVLAGLRPGARKCDAERSLTGVVVGSQDDALRRAVLRALASPFAGLRTLATRVRLASGWQAREARAVWVEARRMLASRVPAARDGAARYLAVVCRDHPEYVEEARRVVVDGEMLVADVVDMNARLQLAADLRDVCGIEVSVEAWTWEVMVGWVEALAQKVGELVSASAAMGHKDNRHHDDDNEDDDDDEQDSNSDGSDAKHLLVTTWHTLVLVSSTLVTLALAQPATETAHSLFPLLAQTICTLRHAGAVQNVTRHLVRLYRGLPALQPTWRAWVWTMLSTPTSSPSSSPRLDTRYSGPRLVLRLVLDPSTPAWLDTLFSPHIAPHTALLLANGLLQDTSLGPKLVQVYATAVLDLALRHASDKDASVRSAAIKLVVNWSHRMLVLPNRSAAELFVQRPNEAKVLVRVLAEEQPPRMGAVVGVLMVLGQVALGATAVSVPGVDARGLVDMWLAHPIAHVRKLAGVAVVRMATSVREVREAAERVVDEVLGDNGPVGQNRVHGVLLLVGELFEVKVVSAEWVRDTVERATTWMCPVNELVRKQVLARVAGDGQETSVIGSDNTVMDRSSHEISPATPLPSVLDLALHSDPSLRLAAATATMRLHSFRIPLAPYLTAWYILRAMPHTQLVALASRAIFPVANGTDPSLASLVKSRMIAPTRGEGREWEDPVVTLVLVHLAGERLGRPAGSESGDDKDVAEQVCVRFEREWAELAASASASTANRDGLQLQLAFHPAVWTRLVQYRVVCALVGREFRVHLDEAVQVLEAVERVCCESVVAVEQRMVDEQVGA